MPFSRIATLLAIGLPTVGLATASADPITITSGYIQVGTVGTDFVISTTVGGFAGEKEPGAFAILLSGFSGETVNLSTTLATDIGGRIDAPDRQDFAGRVDFSFT